MDNQTTSVSDCYPGDEQAQPPGKADLTIL